MQSDVLRISEKYFRLSKWSCLYALCLERCQNVTEAGTRGPQCQSFYSTLMKKKSITIRGLLKLERELAKQLNGS